MGIVTGLVVFFVSWFIVLFAVLPWGVRPAERAEPGQADGAPDNPRLGLKFAVTTAIAAFVWLVIFGIVESEIFSFREFARGR
ncbi:MAG: DUF1467 family protein [Inquilinus sp.]|nr:DUF1467 family protein [Inquilinus sp.]